MNGWETVAPKSYFRSKGSAYRGEGARPEKLRNGRLKEVLLRDKPEVIRQRPKHFFLGPATGVEESLLPLASAPFLFARITGPRTNIHSRLTPLFTDGCLFLPPLRHSHPPQTPFFSLQLYISLSPPWLFVALVYFSPPSSLFFPSFVLLTVILEVECRRSIIDGQRGKLSIPGNPKENLYSRTLSVVVYTEALEFRVGYLRGCIFLRFLGRSWIYGAERSRGSFC